MEIKNLIPNKTKEQSNKLDLKEIKATLDFLLVSETDIEILNKNHKLINAIKSKGNITLGEAIILNQAKNVAGEVKEFSYVKIYGKIIPIDSNILEEWAFETTEESNKTPVLKEQISENGKTSYVRYNGNVSVVENGDGQIESQKPNQIN